MAKKNEITQEKIKELKSQLAQQERQAFEAFEAEQKRKRQEAIDAVATPLKAEREALDKVIEEAEARIKEIDARLAALTDQPAGKGKRGAVGTGKRRRFSNEEKAKLAATIYGRLSSKPKTRFSAGTLADSADGISVKDLVSIWNKSHGKNEQIQTAGERSGTRYFVE